MGSPETLQTAIDLRLTVAERFRLDDVYFAFDLPDVGGRPWASYRGTVGDSQVVKP